MSNESRKRSAKPVSGAGRLRLDLPNYIPYRITALAALVRRALADIYRGDPGLSEPEWKVMTTLAHYGPLPSADIGRYVTLDRVAVSRALARLMKLRLATRIRNAADRRMFVVDLTARATRLYDRMAGDAQAIERRMLASLGLADKRRLLAVLDAIEASLRGPADRQRLQLLRGDTEPGPASRKRRRRR
jgi:DNA-binding MarR family transcriptional regulator